MKKTPTSKHHKRRRNKRIFITLETIILVALVCLVCFFAGEASTKFDAIESHLADSKTYTDSMVARLDSLDGVLLVVDGGCRAGEVIDFVDLHI